MRRWDNVLFDLDGTLTDPKQGITTAVSVALRHFGIEEEPDRLTKFIGPPLAAAFREFYGLSEDDSLEAVRQFRVYFADRGWAENVPYPGMHETLARLRGAGLRLIVATSKPEVFAVRILEHFGMIGCFDLVCGAPLEDQKAAEKDRIIRTALERAGICDFSRTVMVGDRKHDIEGAHAVGLPAIGVLYGYGGREELEKSGADAIVGTVEELETLLREGENT